jgi:hypothetical protein
MDGKHHPTRHLDRWALVDRVRIILMGKVADKQGRKLS